jgi:RNA recognition motif-containing protein
MNLAAMHSGMGLASGFQAPKKDLSENVCIKMRGLPYNAQTKDILEFFEGYKLDSTGILIMRGPDDRPTGEAFVEFVSPDEAQRAMERHKKNMGSRYIELFRATKR